MKTILLSIFLIFIVTTAFTQVVNGEVIQVEDKTILRIWGTHQERGFAYGYLMAEEIRDVIDDYFIGSVFFNTAFMYENARSYFEQNFSVEGKYHTEAEAMIDGIEFAGISIYSDILNRDLDEIDVLFANSIVDIANVFGEIENFVNCSSLSSWGASTIQDPELSGEILITRHLDWTPHQTLLDNQLIIVNLPSEDNEQAWISFSIAGLIGALSAINENNVAAFMNVGNYHTIDNLLDLHPIFFSIRNGIESYDLNQNGVCNSGDIASALISKNHLSGSITHAISSVASDSSAIVIECNNEIGTSVRTSDDNTQVPGDNLVATNHFRELYDPIYCFRYENIVDSLSVSTNITSNRSWDLLCGAAGITGNIQTIQFIPLNGNILWATSPNVIYPAFSQDPTEFTLNDLLFSVSIDEVENNDLFTINSYPNPFHTSTTIYFNTITSGQNIKVEIFNIKGQKIKTLDIEEQELRTNKIVWDGRDNLNKPVSSGIYFYNFEIDNKMKACNKMLLIK